MPLNTPGSGLRRSKHEFFWVVVALVALLFILFRMFRESVKSSAVQNAFLAKYTYDQLTEDQQRQVHDQTLQKIRAGWPGSTENMPDLDFNLPGILPEKAEMIKFSFYGSTMAELGIDPSLAGEKWHYVKRPFLAFHGEEQQVRVMRYHFQHTHKVNIDFKPPEDGQNLNFVTPVERIGEVKQGRKQVADGQGQTEWLKRASALEKLKDWQGMLDMCRKWTKSEPEDAYAWYELGSAYGKLKRYDDAIGAYHQAIRIDPEDAYAWNQKNLSWYEIGSAYGKLKRYDDAIGAYHQAIRIDPEDAYAWNLLGVYYALSGNRTAALEAVQELRRLDPAQADKLFHLIDPSVPR
jgi:tetratricopeptide (TPR) repeat protein